MDTRDPVCIRKLFQSFTYLYSLFLQKSTIILQLGASAIESLGYMCHYASQCDYANALAVHSQMVQGADFSTISHFMPALKSLLHTAATLRV